MAACTAAMQPRAKAGAATLLDCSSDGVLSHVLPQLSDEALLSAACVSRDWRALVDDTLYGAGLRTERVSESAFAGRPCLRPAYSVAPGVRGTCACTRARVRCWMRPRGKAG